MGIFTSFMSNLFSTALLSKASHPKATATATAASTAANVIDTLFTSEEERLDKQTVLARAMIFWMVALMAVIVIITPAAREMIRSLSLLP